VSRTSSRSRNSRKGHREDPRSQAGSRLNRRRKRVGRGIGGKGGKTAGRGTKGQGARDTIPAGFEGGQLPLHQRVPKLRGFNNPFRIEYQAVNLDTIVETGLTEIDPEALREAGVLHKGALVKVLGRGSVSTALHVKAHAFSKWRPTHHGGPAPSSWPQALRRPASARQWQPLDEPLIR
jgi:large subunit ribosomal protein L15